VHFKGLDLNLLVILDALLAEQSITRAAERIHLGQPATSGALARLREFFGDELLVQIGHRMVLTPRAEALIEPVRSVLMRAEEVINNFPTFMPTTSVRSFRLMMSDYVAAVLIPSVLEKMQIMAPGVGIELLSSMETSVHSLERGELDFLIAPKHYISKEHPWEELLKEDYVCVVWSRNDLVTNGISLDRYLSLGHVSVRFGKQRMPSMDEWFFERFGHKRRVEVVSPSFNLVPQLVLGTARIATIPESLARWYARYLPIRLITPPIDIPPLCEVIQWHRYRDLDSGTAWLRKLLKEVVQECRVTDAQAS
jgi:LysR family transcriptional regulator, nod-box dependent transcriptional activator